MLLTRPPEDFWANTQDNVTSSCTLWIADVEVDEIRRLTALQSADARRYGVQQSTISRIKNGVRRAPNA